MTSAFDNKRFLFVTGKGGTGKTTVTAALALKLASEGKRVLCAMCQARERLSSLLEGPPIGNQVTLVREGIWAVNMDPDSALEEYGRMVLKIRAIYRAVFENHLVRSFFRATPGLNEWAMLGKAWFHTTEKLANGSPRFDTVILDAPATGHGLDMLRGPKVIVDVAPPGLLRREAARAWKLFSDPKHAGVVVVTLPEEMPVTETFELIHAIQQELHLPIVQVVANGVLPQLMSEEARAELWRAGELDPTSAGDEAIAAGMRRARREASQQANISLLNGRLPQPAVQLPHLFDEVQSLRPVQVLADRLG
ncbi:MAG: anion-transporting ATPase [Deltaproteobacteria bacterium]|nr:anion-transporting ATPase [Deltaproteobacteria bacterium]